MDPYNTEFLLKKIRVDLKEEPTTLSKQLIKAAYMSYFTKKWSVGEETVKIAIKELTQIGIPLEGNEPATSMLKSSYINWFTKTWYPNEINVKIAIDRCAEMGIPLLNYNEPAGHILKSAYIN